MDKAESTLGTLLAEELLQEAIERKTAQVKKDLIEFSCFIDPQVAEWYKAKHLRRIADALTRAADVPNSRLVINIAPRHWKSSLASEKFPSWYLGLHPERSVILASWGLSLAASFSRRVRDTVMENERYHTLFPKTVVRPDRTWVEDWVTTKGFRSSFRPVGVGGGIAGFGANLIIVDDPVENYEASQSVTQQKMMWNWYRSTLRTRAEPGASIVIIMTRWNEQDLVGKLLDAEKNEGGEHWETLEIPAVNSDGTYLWEERFKKQDYEAVHASIGDYAWRAQYLCNPGSDEGAEIQSTWFKYFPSLPDGAKWAARAWDLAITEKQVDKPNPDYTATVKACVFNGSLWLGEPRLFRTDWTNVQNEIKLAYANEKDLRHGTGKAAVETATVQSLIREGVKLEQVEERKAGDHRARAAVWINWARTGRVNLVGAPEDWDTFMAQWKAFPAGHDDAVDVVSDIALMFNLTFNPAPHKQSEHYDKEYVELLRKLGSTR